MPSLNIKINRIKRYIYLYYLHLMILLLVLQNQKKALKFFCENNPYIFSGALIELFSE